MRQIIHQIKNLFLSHINEISSQLTTFNYAQFIWAFRSLLATIISLLITYFFSHAGMWLISSSVIGLQIYAYSENKFKRKNLLRWTMFLSLCGATIALFSSYPEVLYSIVVISIFCAFYFGHRSNTHATLGLWSATLIIINAFFPIDYAQWPERIMLMAVGMLIAYLTSQLKFKKNHDETIPLPMSLLNTNEITKKDYLKYAIKGGIIALLVLVVAHILHIRNNYWVLFGAITVTKLKTDASLQRSKQRIYGTLIGVGISLLMALCLLHWPLGITIIIPLCIFGAVYYLPHYAIAMIFITVLFVLTFGVAAHNPVYYGIARIMDTALGVALALTISYLWPYKETKKIN